MARRRRPDKHIQLVNAERAHVQRLYLPHQGYTNIHSGHVQSRGGRKKQFTWYKLKVRPINCEQGKPYEEFWYSLSKNRL